jgi:hypothetical protein
MAAPLWVIVTILYVGGKPVNGFIIPGGDEATCKATVTQGLKDTAPKVGKDTTMVARCIDLSKLPVTAQATGAQDPGTDL